MRSRSVAALGAAVVALTVLVGCGGQSPYCAAVEKQQKTLDEFGADKSDKAFDTYAKSLAAIAAEAPADIKKSWSALSDATQAVVTAHADVGFKLEDMNSAKKREGLSAGDIATLNKTYKVFNDTAAQRKAVIDDAKQTCDITLK